MVPCLSLTRVLIKASYQKSNDAQEMEVDQEWKPRPG